jgi:HPt (histidine-containing phosphotransfer) domain-containing protein
MYHAHNSAGASAFCGANELSAILYSMEKAGEDGNFEFAALLLEHARDGFSRLKAEINVLTRAKE